MWCDFCLRSGLKCWMVNVVKGYLKMQISASTFSDPAMRPHLQLYYENKKAVAVEAWKARENEPSGDVKIKTGDGQHHTVKMIPITAEQMEKAIVSFDKWLEFQAEFFNHPMHGPEGLQRAQERLALLEQNNPDSDSNVRATFAGKEQLFAYITSDGGLVTSNGADYLQKIAQKADEMGLRGQSRIDYLSREIRNVLAKQHTDLTVTIYNDVTSPTKREFADMWYVNFDVDKHYRDAMREAENHLMTINAWHQQWQKNMHEIQSFLLSLQEAV